VDVLHAFSDPVRLEMVRQLDHAQGSIACGQFSLPVAKSTRSHHFKVLREAGVVRAQTTGPAATTRCAARTSTPVSPTCSTRSSAPPTKPPWRGNVTPTAETRLRRYFETRRPARHRVYFALFADDATVEDEGREHHGLDAIRAWRAEVPSSRTPSTPRTGRRRLRRHVDIAGDFPGSPVRLTFHFEFDPADRITTLTIRP